LNFALTELSEVHTILIDSLRVFSEKAAIVCLFGARRDCPNTIFYFLSRALKR
jgi:hypothetical protein